MVSAHNTAVCQKNAEGFRPSAFNFDRTIQPKGVKNISATVAWRAAQWLRSI